MRRLAIAQWLVLAGTGHAGEATDTAVVSGWIRVQVPAGFTMIESDRGLTLRHNDDRRTPMEIRILRRPVPAPTEAVRTRDTPMGAATWAISRSEAVGSGGPEWMLWIRHPAGWITGRQQRELGEPDFAAVWEIVDSIRPAD